jgi:hypothetical protein
MVFRRFLIALGAAGVLAACGGIVDPAKNTIVPFSGTLNVLGTTTFNYSWNKSGEIEVTVTSVTPPPANGQIGMQLGQVLSGTCSALAGYTASVVVNRKVQFGLLNKGSYCLVIFDTGVLTTPVNFSGNFSHP